MSSWYSNGKIMLTGEYAVLLGATCLAMPIRFGQRLTVEPSNTENTIHFETTVLGNQYFKGSFDSSNFKIQYTTNIDIAQYIQALLTKAKELNPNFLAGEKGLNVHAEINFNIEYGLGSSSSLISNIAYWANIDPFTLNKSISKGSGYDIACARANAPIQYTLNNDLPTFLTIKLDSIFLSNFLFVYLNKKQPTNVAIGSFFEKERSNRLLIDKVSALGKAFIEARDIQEIGQIINEHERIIGNIINQQPIKERLFSDFDGYIKSLGAWGGDFCLVASNNDKKYINEYFKGKGFSVMYEYNELILNELA